MLGGVGGKSLGLWSWAAPANPFWHPAKARAEALALVGSRQWFRSLYLSFRGHPRQPRGSVVHWGVSVPTGNCRLCPVRGHQFGPTGGRP